MFWSWLSPAHKKWLCTSFLSSPFNNVTLVTWNWPWWEHLHHENWQILQIKACFSECWLLNIYYHQKHKRQQVLPQNPLLGKWEKLSSDAPGDHVLCGSKSECYSSCTTNTSTTPCLCFLSAYNGPSIILSILYHVLYNVILTTILWGQYHSSTLKRKLRHPRMM